MSENQNSVMILWQLSHKAQHPTQRHVCRSELKECRCWNQCRTSDDPVHIFVRHNTHQTTQPWVEVNFFKLQSIVDVDNHASINVTHEQSSNSLYCHSNSNLMRKYKAISLQELHLWQLWECFHCKLHSNPRVISQHFRQSQVIAILIVVSTYQQHCTLQRSYVQCSQLILLVTKATEQYFNYVSPNDSPKWKQSCTEARYDSFIVYDSVQSWKWEDVTETIPPPDITHIAWFDSNLQ